jgi:hypothetical protein
MTFATVTIRNMFRLIGEKLKVANIVVRLIAVNMVNNFTRVKVATYVLFHDVPVFKQVFSSRRAGVCWAWVIVWYNNLSVQVRSMLYSAIPARCVGFPAPIHGIFFTGTPAPIHGVLFPANISVERRVIGCKVSGSHSTTARAIFSVWFRLVLPELLTTLLARHKLTALLGVACTPVRTV